MARPTNLEPTASTPIQDANWKRKAADRINYLLQTIEQLETRLAALEPSP